ncbi:hypothetical protein GCM10029978_005330 [Actinoallomurus acanthiterrae]
MRITPILHKAGIAAAAVTLTALSVTAAGAATKTPTDLTLSGLPATIAYGQFQQTVHGTLRTRVPAGQTPQPVPGATVQVYELMATNVPLGTATTDENGDFSLPVTLPAPGGVEASFAGDDAHFASWGGVKVAPATRLPTRITLQGPASAAPQGPMTVTGQVTVQTPDGTWAPAPYDTVNPVDAAGAPSRVASDADGRFSFPAAAWHSSLPRACVDQRDGTFVREACSDPLVTPYSPYPVRIIDFKPEQQPLNPGHFSFFADVTYEPDDAGTAAYDGPVVLQYQPKGSKTWITMATGTATGSHSTGYESYGEVEFKNLSGFLPGGKGVLAAGGTWEVRTPAQGRYLAAQNSDQMSLTGASAVVDAWTYITGSKVTSQSGKRYLTGYLTDDHGVGPLPKMKIKVYYRKTKSAASKYLGYVTTGADGRFRYQLTGHAHGYYQGVFAGAAMPGGADKVGSLVKSTGALVHY